MDESARSDQQLRLLTGADGVRIAVATVGVGQPLVRAAHWLSHLELDWQSVLWRDFLVELASGHMLIRYDERGTGLSDREVSDLSFEAMVGDLETTVDQLGIERFAILGMSQGASIAISYAVRHPDRVSGIVICGGYARGHAHRGRTPEQQRDAELLLKLIRAGWGTPNPKFRRVFATMFLADGSPEQYRAFDELQRVSATPEVAYRLRRMFDGIDVVAECGRIEVPTLVMHARDDAVVPFEEGRLLAVLIPHSRFVPLEGRSHILLPGTPAWSRFFTELRGFLAAVETGELEGRRRPGKRPPEVRDDGVLRLSSREREVMDLVAAGQSNAEIAASLAFSPRTVERHLSNVYAKLGLLGKAARAAAAARVAREDRRRGG